MNTDKKIQVVMLATVKSSALVLNLDNKLEYDFVLSSYGGVTQQNLYFLSDDEIKEGDWVINQGDYDEDIVFKADEGFFDTGLEAKKIIATTDSKLRIDNGSFLTDGYSNEVKDLRKLPEPSKEWIEYFVSEYNKSNIITEVMVEYEVFHDKQSCFKTMCYKEDMEGRDSCVGMCESIKLKINPDNSINIKPVEETWDDIIDSIIPEDDLVAILKYKNKIKKVLNNYQVPKQLKK